MDQKNQYRLIVESNQRTKKGFRYTVPSSSVYPNQWLWDSCFHAIIYLSLNETDYAKDEVRALLHGQWGNGMIPHVIYWDGHHDKLDWGTVKDTSSLTQPPMVAYAVERIYSATKDKTYVKEVFDSLDRYYRWLQEERGLDSLITIIHPWESGLDDFGSWDSVYGVDNPTKEVLFRKKRGILIEYVKHGTNSKEFIKTNIFNVRSVLFNAVYLKNLRSTLSLAKIINSDKEKYYAELIPKVESSFRKNHLHESGLYASLYNENIFVSSIENVSIFLPLFCGVLTKSEARTLVEVHLLNEEKYWSKFPIPTMSMESDIFDPDRYWRGSTWININWFVYKGLRDYGFHDVAEELRRRSIASIEESGFHEYFNPLSGKGSGPNDFCWSGLIFDMD